MTATAKVLIESKQAESAQTTQFTAIAPTLIDKFTVTNTTGGAVTFAVNLVPSGSGAGTANLIMSKSIAAGETYTCPGIVGHVLNTGDLISTVAGAATSLTIRASGREIT